jgi:hypothetical protein
MEPTTSENSSITNVKQIFPQIVPFPFDHRFGTKKSPKTTPKPLQNLPKNVSKTHRKSTPFFIDFNPPGWQKNDVWLQRGSYFEMHGGHFCRYLALFGHLATRMYAFFHGSRHRGCTMYAFLRIFRHRGCRMYAFLRSFWMLISCIFGPWLLNGFQEASRGTFVTLSGPRHENSLNRSPGGLPRPCGGQGTKTF